MYAEVFWGVPVRCCCECLGQRVSSPLWECPGRAAGSSWRLIPFIRREATLALQCWKREAPLTMRGFGRVPCCADAHRISERILDTSSFLLLFQLQLQDLGPAKNQRIF